MDAEGMRVFALMSSLTSFGAGRLGMSAVVMIMSASPACCGRWDCQQGLRTDGQVITTSRYIA